jgi:thioredoxin
MQAQQTEYKQVSSSDFQKLIQKNDGTLLDVRTLNEFKNGHLKEAGQLNYYAFSFKSKLLLLSKDQPIYLYCTTGWRSERAAKILVRNGYKEVYNLAHGIMEWNLQNFPIVMDADAEPDKENFMSVNQYKQLISGDKMVLIDFYAPWCAPCRQMMPMIDSLQLEYKDKVDILKINVDASKKLMKELRIMSVPFFTLYQNGEVQFQHHGLISKQELVEQLDSKLK